MAKINMLDFDEGGHRETMLVKVDAAEFAVKQALETVKQYCNSRPMCEGCCMETECTQIRTKSDIPAKWVL